MTPTQQQPQKAKKSKESTAAPDLEEKVGVLLDEVKILKGALAVNNALLRQVLDALPKKVSSGDLIP